MSAFRIVEPFDVIERLGARFVPSTVASAVESLFFHPREEAFHDRIVVTFAKAAHAALARPEPVNEAYVDRANELRADGGHARLAGFLVSRPREAAVNPFLLPWLNTEETDQYGRTRLCNGVVLLNPETVQAELARGADPNGLCNGDPLALHVALIATREYVTERQTILGLLLESGATVDDVSFCNSTDMGDCATVLYPIFRQYGFE